jgi:hypothetical protein
MVRLKSDNRPKGTLATEAAETKEAPSHGMSPFAVILIILAVFVGVYLMFGGPHQDTNRMEQPTTMEPSMRPESARNPGAAIRHKHPPHAASASTSAARPHGPASASAPTYMPPPAKHAAPMKLWENTKDDEGGN